MRLSPIFLAHHALAPDGAAADSARPPGPDGITGDAELEQRLQGLLDAARSAWPSVQVADELFVRYLAERMPKQGDLLAALASTHGADLYLACACAGSDPEALRLFDTHFISQVATYLRRADALPTVADEVKQTLRTRLLVGGGRPLPRIALYSGRGPLGAWLRVTAAREALHLREAQGVRLDAVDLPLPGATADPEIGYLKTHYAGELRAAFESTLRGLSRREGAVLRLHFLEGMTAAAIGALFRVSGRTIQRWIAELRSRILAETRRRLGDKLGLSGPELESLVGLLQSGLDVSITSFLEISALD